MRKLAVLLALLASGCAYDEFAAIDRCNHNPGCVSTHPASGYGPGHAAAIAPKGP